MTTMRTSARPAMTARCARSTAMSSGSIRLCAAGRHRRMVAVAPEMASAGGESVADAARLSAGFFFAPRGLIVGSLARRTQVGEVLDGARLLRHRCGRCCAQRLREALQILRFHANDAAARTVDV